MDIKILIADNDLEVCSHLAEILRQYGYYPETVSSPSETGNLDLYSYSLFISEVSFEHGDSGTKFLQKIRGLNERDYAPFIFYSADSDSNTIVECLNSGADDYIVKPENDAVLVAKADSVIRRIRAAQKISNTFRVNSGQSDLNFKNIRIDRNHKKVLINGTDIKLTKHEFELLYFLIENLDTVKSRKQILYLRMKLRI